MFDRDSDLAALPDLMHAHNSNDDMRLEAIRENRAAILRQSSDFEWRAMVYEEDPWWLMRMMSMGPAERLTVATEYKAKCKFCFKSDCWPESV